MVGGTDHLLKGDDNYDNISVFLGLQQSVYIKSQGRR
jgi:hypothetical protein